MMFEIFIKTKKAIPHLGKIALAIVLLLTIIFAYFVQKSKSLAYTLTLDKKTHISTPVGKVLFKISSQWEKIHAENLPENITAGWKIKNNKTNIRFYIARTGKSDLVSPLRLIADVNKIFPSFDIIAEPEYETSSKFPSYISSAAIILNQNVLALFVRTLLLPDNSAIILMFIGEKNSIGLFDLWDKQIAETIEFEPSKQVEKIPINTKKEISWLTFKTSSDLWIIKDKHFNLLTITPVASDASKLWLTKLKIMKLPEYRKSEELIIDHFIYLRNIEEQIKIKKQDFDNRFEIYFAKVTQSITFHRKQYKLTELCWLIRKNQHAVFISLKCENRCIDSAQAHITSLIKSFVFDVDNSQKIPHANIHNIKSNFILTAQTGKLTSWYLIRTDSDTLGFETISYSTRIKHKKVTLIGIDYIYFASNTLEYIQREKWKLNANNFSEKYTTYIDMINRNLTTFSRKLLSFYVNTSSKKINIVTRLSDGVRTKEFNKPAEFIPEGSFLLFLSAFADAKWAENKNTLSAAKLNIINSHLQSVVLKRIKNDNQTKVLLLEDSNFSYDTYNFNKDNQLITVEFDSNIKIVRSTIANISKIYRVQSRLASRYISTTGKMLLKEDK